MPRASHRTMSSCRPTRTPNSRTDDASRTGKPEADPTLHISDSLSSASSAQPTPSRSSGSDSPLDASPPDLLLPFAPAPASSPSALTSGDSPGTSRPSRAGDQEIEMESMAPGGHRRRRSGMTNSPNGNSSPPARRSARAAAGGSGGGGSGLAGGSSGAGPQSESKRMAEHSGDDGRRPGQPDSDSDILSDEDLHGDEETGLTKSHRLRKREKRRNNTRLDQRIVRGGDGGITEQEKREADKSVLRRLLINASLIGLWYIFSLGISIYNKWMFDSKQLDFPFPLFTTSIHMFIQFTLASLVLYLVPSLRPKNSYKSDRGQSRHEAGPERPLMTKWFYFTRIGPCGAATGLDIGLGNTSLKLITLTFYTMCKSSVLAFVLLFAFLFRLETPTWRLMAIIGTMTAGVVMMVAGEVEFKLGGFLLVISAAFFSGFRWGLTQILLLRNPATSNPFSSIFFLAPVMFFTLFSIAVVVEGLPELVEGIKLLAAARGAVAAPLIVIFPGAIAFLMTVSEFALLQRTSVVTLSIAGIFKEVVTIMAAALVFGDKLTPINLAGLIVTLAAICSYNYLKITKMRREALESAHNAQQDEGESGGSGSEAELDVEDEDAALLQRLDPDGGAPRTTLWTADSDMLATPESASAGGGGGGGGGTSPRPHGHERED